MAAGPFVDLGPRIGSCCVRAPATVGGVFESRHEEILPLRLFLQRMLVCFAIAAMLILAGLGIGVLGYHFLAALPWIDALLNASMILTGMGPVDQLHSAHAKLFAAFYALFSGLIFISLMGLLLSPIAHRVLHKFHVSEEDLNAEEDRKAPNQTRRPR